MHTNIHSYKEDFLTNENNMFIKKYANFKRQHKNHYDNYF